MELQSCNTIKKHYLNRMLFIESFHFNQQIEDECKNNELLELKLLEPLAHIYLIYETGEMISGYGGQGLLLFQNERDNKTDKQYEIIFCK